MQYTIESRQLTSEYTHRPALESELRTTTIEAADAAAAISRFVHESECELVSYTRPVPGRETIATVKKNESVYLVRVYRN